MTIFAGLLGFVGVALGAFGAHGLEGRLSPAGEGWWQTATLYALVHAAAGLAVALSGQAGLLRLGGWAMLAGAALFAATLYAMALGAPRWLGAVTPLGGIGMLVGWGCIVAGGVMASR